MGLLPLNMMNNSKNLLDLISMRQEALSDNIANMHTIGYKRRDVDFSQYLKEGASSSLENKIVDKFGTSPLASSSSCAQNLTTEEELGLMQQNYVLFNIATKELKSTVTQIKTALNVSANG